MARKTHDTLPFDTMLLEGALFIPDLLEKSARGEHTRQRDSDYHIPKGLKLHDEYGRAFQIALAQWQAFAPAMNRQDIDPAFATRTFIFEFLSDALGYTDLHEANSIEISGRGYPVTFLACGQVPMVVAPYTLPLDEPDPRFAVIGSGSRKKSAFRLAQEFLNASVECTWALVTNGRELRLLRDAATLTRPSFLEFDLATILGNARYPDFAALWRILHSSRAGEPGKPGLNCIWEAWREEGRSQGTRVREGLRKGVTQALIALGEGFVSHPANDSLRRALDEGTISQDLYFQELLRLVYRFLFLFTLEERELLHPVNDRPEALAARTLYAEGYAVRRLRNRSLRRTGFDGHDDLWQGQRIIFRSLYHGEPRLALPALGGLFAPEQCPTLDQGMLTNRALLTAMYHLRWAMIDGTLSPVDYRNMGTEELGSVYESLLELVPSIDLVARHFGFVGLTEEGDTAGNARKTSGSYYTPDTLVQELIKSALDPVIETHLAARPDNPTEALLAISVIDPACGSGHFLFAAARRLAERLAELKAIDGAVKPEDYRHALREVIGHSIYGVDRNPMALELARFALWLEGFDPGRPLSFLDHHLVCGDALLGVVDWAQLASGIPEAAFKPLSGDDKVICKTLSLANRNSRKTFAKRRQGGLSLTAPADFVPIWTRLASIEAMPDAEVVEVEAKQEAHAAFLHEARESHLAQAADCFVAAFLAAKRADVDQTSIPTSATLLTEVYYDPAAPGHDRAIAASRELCAVNRVLHWPLVFPQVFAKGGFDCVLANPPWERIKLQEEEFFATRHPAVAMAMNKSERGQRITWLSQGMLAKHLSPELTHNDTECEAEQRLYAEFLHARRAAEAASLFAHLKGEDGGRYPLTGVGDVNTYALFAETISKIVAPDGRAGFIVPTGIATDDSTKQYFQEMVFSRRLVSYFGFKNEKFLFPRPVEHTVTFGLFTLLGSALLSSAMEFCWFAYTVSEMQDMRRRIYLTAADIRNVNPNTLTCPVFRTAYDAELTQKIYSLVPIMIRDAKDDRPEENPWGIRFMTMFHMSNDSHLFATENGGQHLPLYEAKMIHQFDHRWASYHQGGADQEGASDVSIADKQDLDFTVTPRYWVAAREVALRTANLPKGLLTALRDGNQELIVLGMTHLLFGVWLLRQGMGTAAEAMANLFPTWRKFVEGFPFAAEFAPTRLGLCGNNEASLKPLGPHYLPAHPLDQITEDSWSRSRTTWYAADPTAVAVYLDFSNRFAEIIGHLPAINTAEEVMAFAEDCLDLATPRWFMGWRGICRATDERTVIASVLPRVGAGNSLPLLWFDHPISRQYYVALLGNLSTLVLDFVARHKIGGINFNFFISKQLPVLPPDRYAEADLAYIVPRVLELTYTSHDLKPWAEDLGYKGPPFTFNPERRAGLRAELDAYYARLYGLSRDELLYILDPAAIMGPDYPSETFRVLKNNEERNFGEYRTQRLVLTAWDRLENELTS
jgi:hypothetical protein